MKIFLSAVSGHFKTCREALRSDLSAVGAQVVAQEDFQQHGASLPEKIERYIASATLPWLGAIVRAEEKIRSRRMEYGVGEQNSVESYRRVLVTGLWSSQLEHVPYSEFAKNSFSNLRFSSPVVSRVQHRDALIFVLSSEGEQRAVGRRRSAF